MVVGWRDSPAKVGCLEKPRPPAGREDAAWACSRRWGASRRWPFDLPTNSLFKSSKTGLASGSQSGKVGKHKRIVCPGSGPRIG